MAEDSQSRSPRRKSGKETDADLKSKISYLPDIHRLLPQAPEAEQGVLSAFLLSPKEVGAMCAEKLIKPGHFHIPAHGEIFSVLLELWDKGTPVDFITITQLLRDRNKIEAVGGAGFVTSLFTFLATATNAEYYIGILQEKHVLREIIRVCTEYAARSYDEQDEVPMLLDKVEQEIFEIAKDRFKDKAANIKDMVMKAIGDIQKLYERRGQITGLETGFKVFDQMTDGLHGAEMIVIAARPSMGKCLAEDSEILLADGRVATIGEIFREGAADLLTLGDDWRLRVTQPSAFVDDGMKPVFRVTTRLGRTVDATSPHPFRTLDGWKPLAELSQGQQIAVPREMAVFGNRSMRTCDVKLLGYLLGDGGLTDGSPEFTNSNALLCADYLHAVKEFGGLSAREERTGGRTPTIHVSSDRLAIAEQRVSFSVRLSECLSASGKSRRQVALAAEVLPSSLTQWAAGEAIPSDEALTRLCRALGAERAQLLGDAPARKNDRNGLTKWLESLGLMGRKSVDKFLPAVVFQLPREQLALLLNRLFATDGWATLLKSGQSQLGFASASERMARQVQHLLLRFGIIGALRARQILYRGARRPAWQLDITDALSIGKFAEHIGMFGKDAALERVVAAIQSRRYQTNSDLIPREVWNTIAAAKGTESWASLGRRAEVAGSSNLHVGKRALSRKRLASFARALGNRKLQELASSEVYWDEVVSIEPLGLRQVYDLTIPETHNFVANDICVHNTAFAMNIAEHIAVNLGLPVAVFSLEMSAQQLVQRVLCSLARVNLGNIRNGFLSERDFPAITAAAAKLAAAKMFIDDTSGLSILELRAKARRMKAQSDIQAIFIDYLQLLRSTSKRAQDNRQLEIAEISSGLKALSKELNIPIVVLAQLNRNPESRTGEAKGRPRLSDLRESGSIEQDADIVTLLVREEYYADSDEQRQEMVGKSTLIIAKQRNGPVGDVPLTFLKEFTRFEDRAEGAEPEG